MSGVIKVYIERWDFFYDLLIQHVALTSIAIGFITILGIVLGIVISKNKLLAKFVLTVVSFMYTIPSIALFGVLIAVTGVGNKSAIVALTIYGMLPIIRSTYIGIVEVDDQIIESAVAMGCTQWQMLFKIQLPLALPVIMSGFRTMVTMTIALGGIASFIGADGLGIAIWRGITTNFYEMTLAGSLLVALLAIIADLVLGIVEKMLRRRILGVNKI